MVVGLRVALAGFPLIWLYFELPWLDFHDLVVLRATLVRIPEIWLDAGLLWLSFIHRKNVSTFSYSITRSSSEPKVYPIFFAS